MHTYDRNFEIIRAGADFECLLDYALQLIFQCFFLENIYVAEVRNVQRMIFFLLHIISPIHRGMETHMNHEITLGRASLAGFIRG